MPLTKVRGAGFDHGQKGNSLLTLELYYLTAVAQCLPAFYRVMVLLSVEALCRPLWYYRNYLGFSRWFQTFNLPDLRGAAIRGTGTHGSSTNGNDGAAFTRGNVGTFENDMHQEHGHNIIYYASGSGSSVYREAYSTASFGSTETKTAMILQLVEEVGLKLEDLMLLFYML